MKVKVDVPATANRKAYSYFREGNELSGQKTPSVNKKAVALGAIALGGLAAGGLAIAGKKKGEGSISKGKASSPPRKTEVGGADAEESFSSKIDKELEIIGKNLEKSGYWDEEDEDGGSNNSYRSQIAEMEAVKERERKNAEAFDRRKASGKFNRSASGSSVAKGAEPSLSSLGNALSSDSMFKNFSSSSENQSQKSNPSVRSQNTPTRKIVIDDEPAISPSKSAKSKIVTSDRGKGVGAIVGKVKDLWDSGWDRDYKARGVSSLKDKEYDLNEITYKAGQGTRSALNSVVNFAGSFLSTFASGSNTINTTASAATPSLKPMPKKTRRANKTLNSVWNKSSRRYESLSDRIDSFVKSLG